MPAYSSSGSVVTGTTSVAPVCPATVNAGDILVLHVETNGTAATTPSGGWVIGAPLTVANSRRGVQYFLTAAGTEGGTTVTVSGLTGGTTSTGVIDRFVPSSGGVLSVPSGVAGTDTSITTTAYSATGGSSIAYSAGDLGVCSYVVTSTTAVLTGFTATALTAGANWGTSTNQRNSVQSGGLFMVGLQTAPVTTGASTAPKMAGNGTGSATVGGVSQFLIIHETVPVAPATPALAAYNFDEGSGTTAADDSGNGNTLTIGTATWPAGHTNTALAGTNAASFYASGTLIQAWPSGGFTGECWVFLAATGDMNSAYAFLVKSSGGDKILGLHGGGGNWSTTGGISGGSQDVAVVAMGTGWHHLACVCDGTSLSTYVDGVLIASQGGLSTILDAGSTGNIIYVGFHDGDTDTCIVDDFRIYGYGLTAANIVYDMQHPVAGLTTPAIPDVNMAVQR